MILWKLLNCENYKLGTIIKKYNINRGSIIDDIIKENVEKMYSLCQEITLPHYIPDDGYWDEYAQLMEGCDTPPHVDPHNIAYYHYRKISTNYNNNFFASSQKKVCSKKDNIVMKLDDRNLKLAKLIEENNIEEETILHQLIKRNISVLYNMKTGYVPKKYIPKYGYWNETAEEESLTYDPNNIAYYYYLILNNEASLINI